MSWVKRNLYFLIGTVVALVLLGLAGFYLYSKWDLNNKGFEALNQSYENLKKLNGQNPHPGSGNVDNVAKAREQIKEVRAALDKTRQYFEKIPPIPDLPKINDQNFSSALDRTIAQLNRDATNNSVTVPANYSFSFQAQRSKMNFAPASLPPLAAQLGEVKAICEILFAAKVNSFDYIRRERVSPDDAAGQSDYLAEKSVTNALAVVTPYEVSFHSFSPELAAVLTGFSKSPHGLLVQFVNIEVSAAVAADVTANTPAPVAYQPIQPIPNPSLTPDAAFRQRYGISGGRPGEGGGEANMRARYGTGPGKFPMPAPTPVQPVLTQPAIPVKTGLPTVIDEKQLKVTLMVNVIKLNTPPATPPVTRTAARL